MFCWQCDYISNYLGRVRFILKKIRLKLVNVIGNVFSLITFQMYVTRKVNYGPKGLEMGLFLSWLGSNSVLLADQLCVCVWTCICTCVYVHVYDVYKLIREMSSRLV